MKENRIMRDEKEKELRSIVVNEPENVHAWINLGIYIEIKKRDIAKAEEIYRKDIEINPNFHGSWLNLGIMILYNKNDINEAIFNLKKANELMQLKKILGIILD